MFWRELLTAEPRLGPMAGLSPLPSVALAPIGCDFWPATALSPSGASLRSITASQHTRPARAVYHPAAHSQDMHAPCWPRHQIPCISQTKIEAASQAAERYISRKSLGGSGKGGSSERTLPRGSVPACRLQRAPSRLHELLASQSLQASANECAAGTCVECASKGAPLSLPFDNLKVDMCNTSKMLEPDPLAEALGSMKFNRMLGLLIRTGMHFPSDVRFATCHECP